MVLLIGNYLPDQQQSMLRFNAMMLQGLRGCDIDAEIIRPPAFFGTIRTLGATANKWFAYIDKFVLFRFQLWRKLAAKPDIVHICDHSNAMFSRAARRFPTIVTCHDMLAVRGGLGEETDCPASTTGKFLQRWILRGLGSAKAIACISDATAADARRLVQTTNGVPRISTIELGLNYPYRKLSTEVVERRLSRITKLKYRGNYIVHVGSNLRRKNREGVLRIFAKCADALDAQIVFVGDALNDALRLQARELGITDRVVEIPGADDETLEAIYSGAFALLYPSRFEGMGWPIAEAQACGCPVVCSSVAPMGDVAGSGALLRAPDDEDGFAAAVLSLRNPEERAQLIERGLENAKRFASAEMIGKYRELYRSVTAAC